MKHVYFFNSKLEKKSNNYFWKYLLETQNFRGNTQ